MRATTEGMQGPTTANGAYRLSTSNACVAKATPPSRKNTPIALTSGTEANAGAVHLLVSAFDAVSDATFRKLVTKQVPKIASSTPSATMGQRMYSGAARPMTKATANVTTYSPWNTLSGDICQG